MTPPESSAGRFRPWLVALLLCLPFWLVWLAPAAIAPEGTVLTGFPQYDQAYYLANGRAIFERGNGLAGPNPYDPDPASPAIYFHLVTWFFGLAVVGFRLDPGLVYVLFGLAAGLLFVRLTLELLARLVENRRHLVWLGPLAIWGGGIAAAAWLVMSRAGALKEGMPPTVFEPGGGWWFLPWGRNLIYTTEAIYHCLVLGILIAFVDRRWWRLTLMLALLAFSHPFTGGQFLLAVGLWTGLNLAAPGWTGVPRLPPRVLAALAVVAGAFAAYYLLFLPGFPAYRELTRTWALDWQETVFETVCAYLPLALAVFFAWRRRLLPERPERVFFALLAALAFLLAHHGWFAKPHQPLHFSHGYLWFPLFLLALPWLERGAAWAMEGGWPRRLAGAGLLLLAAADNISFVVAVIRENPAVEVRWIDRELREIYTLLEKEENTGILLSSDPIAGYLAATYTEARPFYGHKFNTPQRKERLDELSLFFIRHQESPNIAAADLLLIDGWLPPGEKGWTPLYGGKRWNLYQRRR
jgi:hypothetical protein